MIITKADPPRKFAFYLWYTSYRINFIGNETKLPIFCNVLHQHILEFQLKHNKTSKEREVCSINKSKSTVFSIQSADLHPKNSETVYEDSNNLPFLLTKWKFRHNIDLRGKYSNRTLFFSAKHRRKATCNFQSNQQKSLECELSKFNMHILINWEIGRTIKNIQISPL